MKILENSYKRYEIAYLSEEDSHFKQIPNEWTKNGKKISGIYGFHGRLENIIGWLLEKLFHKTVKVEGLGGDGVHYFDCESLKSYLGRIKSQDLFKDKIGDIDTHDRKAVQTQLEAIQTIAKEAKLVENKAPLEEQKSLTEEERNLSEAERKQQYESLVKQHEAYLKTHGKADPLLAFKISLYEPKKTAKDKLGEAIAKKDLSAAEEALRHNLDINEKDERGNTFLHRALAEGFIPLIPILLERGADLKSVNNYGETPLHYVQDKDSAAKLLEKGANPNTKNRSGETPLERAILVGPLDLARFLFTKTTIDPKDFNLVTSALKRQSIDHLNLVLEKIPLNNLDAETNKLLLKTAIDNSHGSIFYPDYIQTLLNHGAKLDPEIIAYAKENHSSSQIMKFLEENLQKQR